MFDSTDPLIPGKSVVIPLRVTEGKLKPFFDMPMPKLKEGAMVDLICEAHALDDQRVAHMLNREEVITLLEKDTTLYAQMRQEKSSNRSALQWTDLSPEVRVDPETFFVPFVIQEDLRLKLRGTRKAEMLDCKCGVGESAPLTLASLNQAYTRLSERYEPSRRSHTGNVFTKILFIDTDGKAKPLARLRRLAEARFHAKLFSPSTAP